LGLGLADFNGDGLLDLASTSGILFGWSQQSVLCFQGAGLPVTGTPFTIDCGLPGLSGAVWSIVSGTLPAGLTLNPSTGLISGTPIAAGQFIFTIQIDLGGNKLRTGTEGVRIVT